MMQRFAVLALLLCLAACGSDMLTTEPGGGYLAKGQSVLVDDGRCPAGQVSRVTGPANLTATRTYACVSKPGGGLFQAGAGWCWSSHSDEHLAREAGNGPKVPLRLSQDATASWTGAFLRVAVPKPQGERAAMFL